MIEVVAAVVMQNGRFLVTSRPVGVHLAGMWEFPGGKTLPAEPHESALEREMGEELGVGVDIHELIFSTTHEYPDRTVILRFYRCEHVAGPIEPREGQAMAWVAPERLVDYQFPPADSALIARLKTR